MKRAARIAALTIAALLLTTAPADAAAGRPTPAPHHKQRHRVVICYEPYRGNARCFDYRPVPRYLFGALR